ncbi:hypothetical protein CspeluHIS016_0602490 [Cutaneotrichosporon spelunceum]|uniref:Protein PBN1 n=1 Tax=Cutaneotrichosporon spelunceum TaxID=1672016 RepID=A0AAD3YEA9_9TREE|nr:hypothetical protein CspeluHIS016_0602490 [Cutaneotrichosporon spelunceum]
MPDHDIPTAVHDQPPLFDSKTAATMRLNATLTSSLHPHLVLTPPSPPAPFEPPGHHITLHLPDALFVDPDELADLWGAPCADPNLSRCLGASHSTSNPNSPTSPTSAPAWRLTPRVVDIERPERGRGRTLRLSFASLAEKQAQTQTQPQMQTQDHDRDQDQDQEQVHHLELAFTHALSVPLHARYLVPEAAAEQWGALADALRGDWYADVRLAWEDRQVPDAGAEVDFAHVALRLPVPDAAYRGAVEFVTAAVVWAGWSWVVYVLFKARRRIKTE